APARRIQMIFMLKGFGRTGMVSLEAYKRSGELNFDMLALDVKARRPLPPRRSPH
ncbi:MAG: hypothetical protein SGPRY_009877, partial [Prymnesium sp.]